MATRPRCAGSGLGPRTISSDLTCRTRPTRAPRTGMSGVGGYARVSKEAGHWLWEASTNFRTPAFRQQRHYASQSGADYVWMGTNLFPQWTKPTSWFRQLYLIGGAQQQQYNFEGDMTDRSVHAFAQMRRRCCTGGSPRSGFIARRYSTTARPAAGRW